MNIVQVHVPVKLEACQSGTFLSDCFACERGYCVKYTIVCEYVCVCVCVYVIPVWSIGPASASSVQGDIGM